MSDSVPTSVAVIPPCTSRSSVQQRSRTSSAISLSSIFFSFPCGWIQRYKIKGSEPMWATLYHKWTYYLGIVHRIHLAIVILRIAHCRVYHIIWMLQHDWTTIAVWDMGDLVHISSLRMGTETTKKLRLSQAKNWSFWIAKLRVEATKRICRPCTAFNCQEIWCFNGGAST